MATVKVVVNASFSREVELDLDLEELAHDAVRNGEADSELGFDISEADNWDIESVNLA